MLTTRKRELRKLLNKTRKTFPFAKMVLIEFKYEPAPIGEAAFLKLHPGHILFYETTRSYEVAIINCIQI